MSSLREEVSWPQESDNIQEAQGPVIILSHVSSFPLSQILPSAINTGLCLEHMSVRGYYPFLLFFSPLFIASFAQTSGQ